MKKDNLISIIIPIYKVSKEYLNKCIISIKNQTYKNIEVLCVCNGLENNIEIYNKIKKIIGNDPRFKIYNLSCKGVSNARNYGIKNCKGKWITFVDIDDWLEKDAIELFINEEKKFNETIDFCIFKNFINKNNIIEESFAENKENHIIDDKEKVYLFQSTFGTKYEKYGYCEAVWKTFYKRKKIIENNIFFNTNIEVAEDMLFNYDVWNKCKNGYFINKSIYHYRINAKSTMNNKPEVLKRKYEKMYPYFQEKIKEISEKYTKNSDYYIFKQIKSFFFIYVKNDNDIKDYKKMLNEKYYKKIIKI